MRALVLSLLIVALLMAFSSIGKAGLVLYYDFETISGDKVIDKSGTGNDGTIMGTLEQVEGKDGKGLLFDLNAANYVDVGEPSFDGLKDGGTIAAWIKPAQLPPPPGLALAVIWKKYAFDLFVYNAMACGEWFKEGNLYSMCGGSGTNLQENEWHHLAATWDGDTLKVYLDGELQSTLSEPVIPLDGDTGPVTIGVTEGGVQPFDGVIDEVTIYDGALTEGEISQIMDVISSAEPSGKLATAWGCLKR